MEVRNVTYKIPNSLYCENREKILKRLHEKGIKEGVIFLEGGIEKKLYDSDTSTFFQQEPFFIYLFGVYEPDFCGSIDISTGKTLLFIPKLPLDYEIWLGVIHPPKFFKKKYGVDDCFFIEQIPQILAGKKLFVIDGINSDSNIKFSTPNLPQIKKFEINSTDLYEELTECRVFKTKSEEDVFKFVCEIASKGQIEMMKKASPGIFEYQLESIFNNYCYYNGGCRVNSFQGICAGGKSSSILHYVENPKEIKDGELVLCDMGVVYNGFCSDITRTFPVNGKFSPDQRDIYNIVLKVQTSILEKMKHGVEWMSMQSLAYEILCDELINYQILCGEKEQIIKSSIPYFFMPHGVGHFLGLNCHDVGGYNFGLKKKEGLEFKSLRTIRKLEEGMIITCEPGCYFNKPLLERALNDEKKKKYFTKKLDLFMEFGGIRIEDDVIVKKDGIENLTSIAPKRVVDIEKCMRK